jgi:integrase
MRTQRTLIMAQRLTDSIVKALPAPEKGNRITYDSDVKGFGCRVTAAGGRAFILNYRTRAGRERRYTIGNFPDWKTSAARTEAGELKKRVDRGEDPMADVAADRTAKTVADLCQRFEEEHLPKTRPATERDYKALIRNEIKPALKNLKVADIAFSDVDDLHRKITKRGAPYVANRTVAVLSKMFSLAIKWGWRSDNPAKGIERNQEEKRHRYLTGKELAALTMALAEHGDQQAANIVRLLLLTGARRGEVQAMRWADLELEEGVWTKPGATTKQKTLHRVPLSAPARQLLVEIKATAEKAAKDKKRPRPMSEYVFPGKGGQGHRLEIKHQWTELCKAAEIVTQKTLKDAKGRDIVVSTPSARLHDLRHTYASVLASAGLSLPVIGALLGHTQAQTTARYAHLFDDPLRAATERAAAIVTGKPSADVIDIDEARR